MLDYLVLGVDVGGTNTDVVALESNNVIAKVKIPTTNDIISGVSTCIDEVLSKLSVSERLPVEKIRTSIVRVNIGTTHFINAVIQRKNLDKVSVIRLCGPSSRAIPPFSDFPDELKETIYGSCHLVNGGYHYDGNEITKVDEKEIISVIGTLKKIGVKNVVISGIFAASNPAQEIKVKEILEEHYQDVSSSLSHEIGHNGLLERENAAILNESLRTLSKTIINGFEKELQRIGINCPFFLTQNDGTLIKASDVLQYPVHTFCSGTTNSLRGASFLSGLKDAIVVDIGGTSTDVGMLRKGFPKEASTRVKVGGVNTNFRMPDVISIGLGGGSIVTKPDEVTNDCPLAISSQSVEKQLQTEAMIFGGNTLTTTDIAVAAGIADIGNPERVANLEKDFCQAALQIVKSKVELTIDQIKISSEDCPVVLVGGGSILIENNTKIEGASKLIKPSHYEVANAIGAALSQVSGTFDRFVDLSNISIEEAVEFAKKSAIEAAVRNGAKHETIEIIEIVDTNISYVAVPTRRIKVKAVGDLLIHACTTDIATIEKQKNEALPLQGVAVTGNAGPAQYHELQYLGSMDDSEISEEGRAVVSPSKLEHTNVPVDAKSEMPLVDETTGEWILCKRDVECLCVGAGVMGCGGGGSPYIGRMRLMKLLEAGKKIRIIDPMSLKDRQGLVSIVAFLGAPSILIEKLIGGAETKTASDFVLKMHSVGLGKSLSTISDELRSNFNIVRDGNVEVIRDTEALQQAKNLEEHEVLALMSAEIGGMNSIEPIITAAEHNLPVIDCDGIGRAYPKLEHFIPFINGCKATPAAIADEKGEVVAVVSIDSVAALEDYFRKHTIRMGCAAGLSIFISPEDVCSKCPLYTLSRAWHIGDAILSARECHSDPIIALVEKENAAVIISGKVTEVRRQTEAGFDSGFVIVEGSGSFFGQKTRIEFQNENLVAVNMLTNEMIATCPDLICVVDNDSGESIPTEDNRYGLRVSVIVIPAMPAMRTENALKVFGPGSFGYKDLHYKPFCEFKGIKPITKFLKK